MAIFRVKIILFLWVCFAVSSILATSVRYCDKKGKYAVKVKGVEMNPDPVVSGEEAKFKISATSGKSITGGEVTITVYFHGIFVHSEKIDLCQETPCPIAPGDFVLSHVQTLPGITPAGPYSLKMSISGNDNELLTCIRFPFKIVRDSQAYVSEI